MAAAAKERERQHGQAHSDKASRESGESREGSGVSSASCSFSAPGGGGEISAGNGKGPPKKPPKPHQLSKIKAASSGSSSASLASASSSLSGASGVAAGTAPSGPAMNDDHAGTGAGAGIPVSGRISTESGIALSSPILPGPGSSRSSAKSVPPPILPLPPKPSPASLQQLQTLHRDAGTVGGPGASTSTSSVTSSLHRRPTNSTGATIEGSLEDVQEVDDEDEVSDREGGGKFKDDDERGEAQGEGEGADADAEEEDPDAITTQVIGLGTWLGGQHRHLHRPARDDEG
ncbi:hypothetical protein HK102_012524, partial [Quaeritorhiza haematococci]